MPTFTYTAFDARGLEKSGQLEASDARHVAGQLRQKGLFPAEVKAAQTGMILNHRDTEARSSDRADLSALVPLWLSSLSIFRPVSAKELAAFTRSEIDRFAKVIRDTGIRAD